MRYLIHTLVFVVLTSISNKVAEGATCTGSDACRACKNCKYCAHCKAGGTCGVCAPRSTQPPPAPEPAKVTPPAAPAQSAAEAAPAASKRQAAKVVRVVDGDTVVVSIEDKEYRVRLLRVNAPESVHPDKAQNIPEGKKASEFTKGKLEGNAVELEAESEDKDEYGRLLRYVYLDGKNYCVELVRVGWSPYYTPYGHGKYRADFEAAEKEARDAKRGLWASEELTEKYQRLKSKWGTEAQGADAKVPGK